MAAPVGKIVWVGRVISIVISLLFLMSAIMKFTGSGAEMEQGLAHIGLTTRQVVPLAILEIACVVIYLVPTTAVLGAILLTGYMGGAICTHWRVGDAFFVQVVLGIVVWVGLYLRDSRLRALMPLRRTAKE